MAYSEKTRKIFSERLRYIMTIRNIRAKDIVEKLNIDKSKVSSYMNGRYLPNQETLLKLSNFLNCDISWLIGLDVDIEKPVKRVNVYSSIHARHTS